MASTKGRWDFRVAAETDQLVRQAAETADRTLTDFVVDAAVIEAERVLADRSQFVLDAEQWARFVEIPLLAAATAGALLWTASQFNLHRTGGYWAAMGVVAAGGLLLGLTRLRGSDANPRGMFLLAFLPVLVVGLWLIITAEPLSNTFRNHLRTWDSHMGITGAVNDIALWNGVIALGIGLVFGLSFEPGTAFRRQRAGDMREAQTPVATAPAEPIAAAEQDKPVERKPAPAPSRFRRSLHH